MSLLGRDTEKGIYGQGQPRLAVAMKLNSLIKLTPPPMIFLSPVAIVTSTPSRARSLRPRTNDPRRLELARLSYTMKK